MIKFNNLIKTETYIELDAEDGGKMFMPTSQTIFVDDNSNAISVKTTGPRKTIGVVISGGTPPVPPEPHFKLRFTPKSGDTVELPCDGDTTLGRKDTSGFSNCYTFEIGSCVTAVDNYAYLDKGGIDTLIISSSVKSIGDWAFARQIINYLVIEEGLEEIGENAFQECWFRLSDDKITLPSTIKHIGEDAFSQVGLRELTILATTPPTVGDDGIYAQKIYVPDESVDLYKADSYFSKYANNIKPISEK